MKSSLKIIVLLALALQVYSSSSSIQAQLAEDEIYLDSDYDGFFADVNLTTSSPTANDTVRLILSLSNSHVLLINDCFDFKPYNCKYYHCTEYSQSTSTIDYQTLVAHTIEAAATVNWNNEYWQLQEKALLATSCDVNTQGYVGPGRYGVLGLGTQGSSKNNFLKTKMFSLWLNSTLQNGVLKFGSDQRFANGSVGTVTASDNWIIPMNGYIGITPYDQDFKGFITFDLYDDALGFPLKLKQYVVDTIVATQWLNPITCETYLSRPTCNYTGYIRDLPDIRIATGQNEVSFVIPPEIYVRKAKSRDDYVTSITLNIKALDNSLRDENYVTPDYNNTIILDARSMSSYYFVFDATGSTNHIQVFKANTTPILNPIQPLPKWVYIVAISIIVVIIVGGCAVAFKKRMASRTPQTTQAPLIVTDSSMNYNNPQVVSGYNYQQQPQEVQYQPPTTYDYQYNPQTTK